MLNIVHCQENSPSTTWSVGTYGEGQWVDAKPQVAFTGLLFNLLRSPEASFIDQLNVMSYDVSPEYDPKSALAAYHNYFKGKIIMGVVSIA